MKEEELVDKLINNSNFEVECPEVKDVFDPKHMRTILCNGIKMDVCSLINAQVFNFTDCLKFDKMIIVGEQIRKEYRDVLDSSDTDITWFVKLYDFRSSDKMMRYYFHIIYCEKEKFISEVVSWLETIQ